MGKSSTHQTQTLCLLVMMLIAGECFHQSTACDQPKLVEYIFNYNMPTDDLKTLINNNISALTIAEIKTKKVTFSETKCALTYIGGQSVSKNGPLSYSIANDAFSVQMHWVANVSKTIGHDTFNVTAQIKEIKLKYTKSYVVDKKQFQITDVNYTLTSDMILIKQITPNESKKSDIEAVVKNELFAGINQQFKSLPNWLNDLASKQKLAETYATDKYQYDYQSWPLTIDTTNTVITAEDNNIVAGYKGDVIGDTKDRCPVGIPKSNNRYKLFMSMPFVMSFAQTVVDKYTGFKNVQIDAASIRTDTFQFKLVDLEYVLDGALQKYGAYYMNSVSFACSAKELVQGFIEEHKLKFTLKWSCTGTLKTTSEDSVPILDGQFTATHTLSLRADSSFSVYNDRIVVTDQKFTPVGDITVKNEALALDIMQQFFNDLRTYIPGTYFKIPANSNSVLIQDDGPDGVRTGIWIG